MNARNFTAALLSAALLVGCSDAGPLAPGNSSWTDADRQASLAKGDPVMPLPPAEPADPVHPILPIDDEDERKAREQGLDPVFPMPPIEDPDPVMPLPPPQDDRPHESAPR